MMTGPHYTTVLKQAAAATPSFPGATTQPLCNKSIQRSINQQQQQQPPQHQQKQHYRQERHQHQKQEQGVSSTELAGVHSPDLPVAAVCPTGQQPQNGPAVCCGCHAPILDQFILQLEGHAWHTACLRCHVCHMTLNHVCYSGNSSLLCQDDFFRLYGASCAICSQTISPSALVRRAHDKLYHEECFRCAVCGRDLETGDQFYVDEFGMLCCHQDFLASTIKQHQTSDNQVTTSSGNNKQNEQRDQLLQTKFSDNPKPSRREIEAVSAQTGMEPTAVRLWFKRRRMAHKRKSSHSENFDKTSNAARVVVRTGGYPLPIVNRVISSESPPEAAQAVTTPTSHAHYPKPRPSSVVTPWDELCSDDFVPPNIDLEPEQIKDGEILLSRCSRVPIQDKADQLGQGQGLVQHQFQTQQPLTRYHPQQQQNITCNLEHTQANINKTSISNTQNVSHKTTNHSGGFLLHRDILQNRQQHHQQQQRQQEQQQQCQQQQRQQLPSGQQYF